MASSPPSIANEAVANVEPDLVLHVAAIGQHDDVAGLEHDRAIGRAFVREGVNVARAPMVEAAGRFRIAVLAHGRILAAFDGEIGAALAGDPHGFGALEPLIGVNDGLLQAGRRHQFFKLVRPVDHHLHAGAESRASLSQRVNSGMCRQTSMSAALMASSVPLQRPMVPRRPWSSRHRIDAHLVGVGAEILCGGERGRHVVAPRPEIAEEHDGLALLHVAELEFAPEQHRELGVVDGFMHDDHSRTMHAV